MSMLCSFVRFSPFFYYICWSLLSILTSLFSSRTNKRTKTAYKIKTAAARSLDIAGSVNIDGPQLPILPNAISIDSLSSPTVRTGTLYFSLIPKFLHLPSTQTPPTLLRHQQPNPIRTSTWDHEPSPHTRAKVKPGSQLYPLPIEPQSPRPTLTVLNRIDATQSPG